MTQRYRSSFVAARMTLSYDAGMVIRELNWSRYVMIHIDKHKVEPYEVEEAVFENSPYIRKGAGSHTYVVYGQTNGGRFLFVPMVITDKVDGRASPLTARDMTPSERKLFLKRR